MKTNERINWAVGMLAVKPADTILEIGCGAGIAAEQIAQKLTSGTITAIDQSTAMIKMASKRNNKYIFAGRAVFLTGKLVEIKLPDRLYDKIFAFNVSIFWKNPSYELQIIKSHLSPDGAFYLFHQPPYDVTKQVAEKAIEQFRKNDFEIAEIIFKELYPAPAFCIISKPLNLNALIDKTTP